jgi:adenylate cyclase
MLKDLETFNEEVTREGIPAFGMGLGINTATVVVGNMGSTQRFDYTCLGDGVNLAARLEGQTKSYGVKLIIGPQTAKLVGDVYQVVELDLIAVKGKTEPARIYTALEIFDHPGEKQHDKFLQLYREGQWEIAKKFANDLKKCWQGELNNYYDMMLERMEGEPPANFDGVYRATSK